LVEVSFGEVKSTFVVTGKELISKKVRMEEHGYWAKKLGRSLEKQEKCDFNNIVYSKIIDEEKIKQINEASCYC
jgi:hypothetical protein